MYQYLFYNSLWIWKSNWIRINSFRYGLVTNHICWWFFINNWDQRCLIVGSIRLTAKRKRGVTGFMFNFPNNITMPFPYTDALNTPFIRLLALVWGCRKKLELIMKSFQQSLHLIKIKDHTRIQENFFKMVIFIRYR